MGVWHTYSTRQTLSELETDKSRGLSGAEAERRLARWGPNRLEEGRRQGLLLRFLGQMKDPMILVLLAAAALSLWASGGEDWLDAAIILVIVVVNACISISQEDSAEKALEALRKMSAPLAKVVRDGALQRLETDRLVPGDIIHLEAGDLVPADARILEAASLQADESAMTGESVPVSKGLLSALPEDTPLAERHNMVLASTVITRGRAVCVVTGTGMDTEVGRIAGLLLGEGEGQTPLQKKMAEISKTLSFVCLCVCAVMFGVGLLQGRPMLDMFLTAVSLAVAAIPEALSSIVTIVQAMGTQKMAKENAIMKELKAVETLGAVSVICSDKTGTLTQNRMTPQTAYVDGSLVDCSALTMEEPIHRRLIQTAILASDATTDEEKGTAVGDPTEVALIMIGDGMGIEERAYREQYPRLCELAFDSDRKLMSTLHVLDGGETVMLTKGALDVLLEHSTQLLTSEGVVELTDQRREQILAVNQELSSKGLRVLAFAYRDMPGATRLDFTNEREYTFIGLISMIDPPRPEAIQAVADAKRGGIRTVMITGDHRVTASAIARQIGILQDGELALSGHELDEMDDGALDQKLEQVSVYARVSPEHKIRIVEAWKRRGKIVAMTGDGVNDAPALKSADIGVAMGVTGTEVSKDAAAMILADDNFATIVKAVVNGRGVYTNIKNAITFLLSGNMAGILSVLVTSILGLPNPFLPVHLLFINLLTDSLPAIAIGVEPSSGDMLSQKPRDPSEPILNWSLLGRIGIYGLLIAAATMAAYFLGLNSGGAPLAMTLAFATLTLARLFHGFNCRGRQSLFALGLLSNKASLAAFAAGVVFLAAVLFVPFLEGLFQVAPFTLEQIGLCAILALLPTVIIQIGKCAGLR